MVIELFLIGVGLSMDAFAVSVCKGLGMEKINKKHAFLIGLYFGGFQALMPFLGWALGIRFQKYITSVDHWIAFFLLLFIGGKMVIEAVRDKDVQEIGAKDLPLDHKEMLLLAVATSIDALAVGITFAFLNVSIMEACLIIGCTTFVLSVIGVVVGNFFDTRYKRKAEIAVQFLQRSLSYRHPALRSDTDYFCLCGTGSGSPVRFPFPCQLPGLTVRPAP